jgi:hypothetical protein
MKGIIEIAIGKRHPLFSSEGEGARCDLMLGEAPLCLAVFAPDLTAAELKPVRIRVTVQMATYRGSREVAC